MWHRGWRLRKDSRDGGKTILWLRALLLLALVWIASLYLQQAGSAGGTMIQKPETSPRPDEFKTHDCFHRDGLREPWEGDLPDGIIAWRGYQKYLVMFRSEAEQRGGHPKWSQEIEIAQFNKTHHHIACPTAWITHNKRSH